MIFAISSDFELKMKPFYPIYDVLGIKDLALRKKLTSESLSKKIGLFQVTGGAYFCMTSNNTKTLNQNENDPKSSSWP